jgi:hypothetical protein
MRGLLLGVLLAIGGCSPVVLGTVLSGPYGETRLEGQAAMRYVADKRGCENLAGAGSVAERRAIWGVCMRSRGYAAVEARD